MTTVNALRVKMLKNAGQENAGTTVHYCTQYSRVDGVSPILVTFQHLMPHHEIKILIDFDWLIDILVLLSLHFPEQHMGRRCGVRTKCHWTKCHQQCNVFFFLNFLLEHFVRGILCGSVLSSNILSWTQKMQTTWWEIAVACFIYWYFLQLRWMITAGQLTAKIQTTRW